jgi:hypothetical protein
VSDYTPISLTPYCNAGLEFLGVRGKPAVGSCQLHGIPFQVGPAEPDPLRCLIGFESGSNEELTVPVAGTARHLLFAHTLIESHLQEGEPIGREVFAYTVRFADGTAVTQPVRERFEVAQVPTGWGHFPFLALPDLKNDLMPRYEGPWGQAGLQQTEARQAWPVGYYLYAWRNPHPERELIAVTLHSRGRKFAVAAITKGHLEEWPFPREARRAVVLELPPAAAAEPPSSLEVSVDRGTATYVYALPQDAADAFLEDPLKGFGEPQNPGNSPAYVEVSATPSATLTVTAGNEELGRANWGELNRSGRLELPRVSLEVVDRQKNWVHVTVVDDATGQPVPCRVHFRSPRGIPYQPHGHHSHVHSNNGTWHIDIGGDLRMGQISYAYIDGRCQGWLPRGEVIVDVARGFEYEPLRQRVQIAPGQRELELRLKRWTDMNARRWFSGDTHVHFLGGQGAHREAGGEDLNVVNLLQSQWGHLFTNTEDFIGRPTVSSDGRTIVYCSQENRQHLLGHITLLGLKEPVMPWCSDGPGEAELGGALEETLAYWADRCHAQGGTVVLPHLPTPNGEPAALSATGRVDAVEMLRHLKFEHLEYYRYLNCGYRLPLVGGTDKMTSDVPVGLYRTYAYLPPDQEFTYDNWCAAVRAGRTFLSGGPLISLRVEGREVGDTLTLSGPGTVEVEAEAESIFPIHTLEVVQQGRVVAATAEDSGTRRLRLRAKVRVEGHTWLAARCGGPGYTSVPHRDGWGRGVFAHTSPVYVACGGQWWMFDREVANYMLTLIDGSIQYIRHTALQHPHGEALHHHGEHDHLAYLERPFQEAAAALHRRMHELGIPH